MVISWRIEANAEKIDATINMKKPKTIWDIQSLNDKVVALSKFLSKSTQKSPIFQNFEIKNQMCDGGK